MRLRIALLVALICCAPARAVVADEAIVAVAASFIPPMQAIAAAFEQTTDHTLKIVGGSTGGLYAQIVNGAPFDVFVAADEQRPRLLEDSGQGVTRTRATVAFGRLVLFSRDPRLLGSTGLDALRNPAVRHIAIANPAVAPYGAAARETLEALNLWETVMPRLVLGESVAQTYAMIATGNAELGFVAMAQVLAGDASGASLPVPDELYGPIRQDVIVLARASRNLAALELHDYLLSAPAKEIIRAHGYATDAP